MHQATGRQANIESTTRRQPNSRPAILGNDIYPRAVYCEGSAAFALIADNAESLLSVLPN